MNHWLWAYQNRQRDVGVPIDSFLVCCWFCIAFLERESPSIFYSARQRKQANNSAVKLRNVPQLRARTRKKQLGLFISEEVLHGHSHVLPCLSSRILTHTFQWEQSHYFIHNFGVKGTKDADCSILLHSFIRSFAPQGILEINHLFHFALTWLDWVNSFLRHELWSMSPVILVVVILEKGVLWDSCNATPSLVSLLLCHQQAAHLYQYASTFRKNLLHNLSLTKIWP